MAAVAAVRTARVLKSIVCVGEFVCLVVVKLVVVV